MAINGSRSNFPGSVDEFLELFDLPYDKVQQAQRLTDLKMQEALTNNEQNEVLSLTTSLQEYMITPERFNKLNDSMYALQKFFYQEVDQYIEDKQALWDTYVKAFKYQGKWIAGKAYKFQNLVTNHKGDLYISRLDHTSTVNNEPSVLGDTAQWAKVGSKGDKGNPGVTGVFKGQWSSSTNYVQNDSVYAVDLGLNGGVLYLAKRSNVGKNPTTSPDDWFLFPTPYIGAEKPLGATKGLHYLRIVE